MKWSSPFPLPSFLQGSGRILLLSSTATFWVPYSHFHSDKRCNTIALLLGHFSKKQEVLVKNYVLSQKELILLVLLPSHHGGLTTVLINTSVPQSAPKCCQQIEMVSAEEVNKKPLRTASTVVTRDEPSSSQDALSQDTERIFAVMKGRILSSLNLDNGCPSHARQRKNGPDPCYL